MAPTTARTADGRVLAIGSPGADRITTALMQVLAQHCLRGIDLNDAIVAPRLHVRPAPDGGGMVEHEPDAAIAAAVTASTLSGHEHPARSMYFGGVSAALRLADGVLAAGDPRREVAVGTV
jgi:gamma-glutamyltranspeptidase/glutathione hydrolase